jgi:hypothetical protein
LDGSGKIIGLKEKGLAKKDETGFVLEPAWTNIPRSSSSP